MTRTAQQAAERRARIVATIKRDLELTAVQVAERWAISGPTARELVAEARRAVEVRP